METNKYYRIQAYPSGRFVVHFIEEGECTGSTRLVREASIPGTSPDPSPLRDQAEKAALTFVEMDKQRIINEGREANQVREFTVPA